MLNVSQAVKDKFQSDLCRKEIRITIGNTVLTNEAIYKDGFRLTESVMDGAVEFVGCIASMLEFKISTLVLAKGNYKGQTVTAEVAVYFDDNTLSSYIPLFYGFVDECTKSADGYYQEFVCYDRLAYLSDEPGYNMYKAAFNGSSVDLETFRESIVRDCGMSVMSSQVLPNDDIIFKKRKRNKDITAMALLRHIAQINGTYGILNRDGQFEFRQIDDSALPEVVAYYRDLTYSDHVVKPVGDSTTNPPTGSITIRTSSQDAGVTVDWTNYQQYAGTDPGWSDESQDTYLVDDDDADVVVDSYIIEGNLIAYKLKKGKKQVIGANILANLGHDAVFREYSVKCNGLPYVECCDKVLFTKGDSSQIEFVVTKRVLEGVQNMTDTYSCTINAQDSNDKSFVSNVDGSTNSLGGSPNEALGLTEKTITENGTYSAMDDGAEGFSQVTVDVEGGGGEGKEYYYPSTDVTPSGWAGPFNTVGYCPIKHSGDIYCFGRRSTSAGSSDRAQLFKLNGNSWDKVGNVFYNSANYMYQPQNLISYKGKLWVFGSYSLSPRNYSSVYAHFDPDQNMWVKDGVIEIDGTYYFPTPGTNSNICHFIENNELHILASAILVNPSTVSGIANSYTSNDMSHIVFNGNTWRKEADTGLDCYGAQAFTFNGKINIIGVEVINDQSHYKYVGHYEYSNGVFTKVAELPLSISYSHSVELLDEVHLFAIEALNGFDLSMLQFIYNGASWRMDEVVPTYDYATEAQYYSGNNLISVIEDSKIKITTISPPAYSKIWTIEKTEVPTP